MVKDTPALQFAQQKNEPELFCQCIFANVKKLPQKK